MKLGACEGRSLHGLQNQEKSTHTHTHKVYISQSMHGLVRNMRLEAGLLPTSNQSISSPPPLPWVKSVRCAATRFLWHRKLIKGTKAATKTNDGVICFPRSPPGSRSREYQAVVE